MIQKGNLFELTHLLKELGLEEFKDYLPSPDYARRVIQLTNAGETSQALSLVKKTKHLYRLIEGSLSDDIKLWYLEIVKQLQRGISTANKPGSAE